MKKVVVVIASGNFRDEEYQKPRDLLEKAGVNVTVACSKLAPSRGMLGLVVKPDVLLKDVKSADYNAIVFVGGSGAKEYWDDAVAHRLAKEFADAQKPTTAICIAPVTLAKAGLLKGRSATAWPDVVQRIQAAGATMKSQGVVADGNFITADGPESAEEFGKALVKALSR